MNELPIFFRFNFFFSLFSLLSKAEYAHNDQKQIKRSINEKKSQSLKPYSKIQQRVLKKTAAKVATNHQGQS